MTRPITIASCLLACIACGSGGSTGPAAATTTPAAATTTPGTSRAYEIVLHRPLKAGDKFHVVVAARQKIDGAESNVTTEQAAIKGIDKNLEVSLMGNLTIREVDEQGRAQSAVLQVDEFRRADTGAMLLPAGSKIDAIRGAGDFSLTVNDSPQPELLPLLRLAFPLHRPGSPLGDELFGSKEPRQIGDTWAFSKSTVARNMLDDGYFVRETGINGETRLVRTITVDGVECLELAAELHADQANVSEQWELMGAGNGKVDATFKFVVPTDRSLPLAIEEATSQGAFEANLKGDGSSEHRHLTLTRYRKAQYTRLSATP